MSQHKLADVAVTGLGVMGSNLARNFAGHGYTVAVHNRSSAKTTELMVSHGDEGDFVPAESLTELVASLAVPRVVIVMVKAGAATDAVVDALVPLLEPGDIVVDAGNAFFEDTRRREAAIRPTGVHFVGVGVSGGEVGALLGPAIMPGGTPESYARLGPMLESIAATVDGVPCCTHVGPDGAGHFVKMVHNGIEYADMEMIGEVVELARAATGWSPVQVADLMARWSDGELSSYLVEVTEAVLRHVDAATGRPFVDIVRDAAAQKGTGQWTVQTALDLGVPVTTIAEATFARALSSATASRDAARAALNLPAAAWHVTPEAFEADLHDALLLAKIVAYSQGFEQIAVASDTYGWGVDRASIARSWRGGCIIRAKLLETIVAAFDADPSLAVLVAAPDVAALVERCTPALRRVVSMAALNGVGVPALAAALASLDQLVAVRLPAAVIQAQRDYFGSHTYRRNDRDGSFHTDWSGTGTEQPA